MSQNLQNFTRAAHILRSVATRVPTEAWNQASCCDGWTAKEVAGHASWVLQGVAATAGDGEAPVAQSEAETAGDDPAATVRASVDRCLAALDRPGVLHTVAATPFGEMPIDDFIGVLYVDPLTHAWDIADAAGIDHGIDESTAKMAHATLLPLSDALRSGGRFGAVQEPAGSDAVSEFVAFAGRRSVRTGA